MTRTEYQLKDNVYLAVTAAGAYFCIADDKPVPARKLLQKLLQHKATPPLNLLTIQSWSGLHEQSAALALLHRMQSLGWITGIPKPEHAPTGSLEEQLPSLLQHISGNDKALLADDQGLYLASYGFNHETAEELAAMGASWLALTQRYSGLLKNLNLDSSALGIIDASGHAQLGCFPLWISHQRFVLISRNVLYLNQPAFLNLVWMLYVRYGE